MQNLSWHFLLCLLDLYLYKHTTLRLIQEDEVDEEGRASAWEGWGVFARIWSKLAKYWHSKPAIDACRYVTLCGDEHATITSAWSLHIVVVWFLMSSDAIWHIMEQKQIVENSFIFMFGGRERRTRDRKSLLLLYHSLSFYRRFLKFAFSSAPVSWSPWFHGWFCHKHPPLLSPSIIICLPV